MAFYLLSTDGKLVNEANGLQMVILSVKDRSDSHSDHGK